MGFIDKSESLDAKMEVHKVGRHNFDTQLNRKDKENPGQRIWRPEKETELKGRYKEAVNMGEEEEKEEEKPGEDQRREEAIASTQCLQPNFKPTRVTLDQLSKLQELHMRRLKMKSKMHKKTKGGSGKLLGNNSKHLGAENHDSSTVPCISNVKGPSEDIDISLRNDDGVAQNVPKKRQKLHWGLDTKERWERKANM